ncbi:MAG: tetratricopeptide repeat protein [Bacteroidaceae bacterium]|nr:tetratricopeptide repeat protein [Bacteroidaceae bacterium]
MKRYILIVSMLLLSVSLFAQRTDREYVRKGNKLYEDSLYIKAEENYLKAIDLNSSSAEAMFNLGNAYIAQQKGQEALKQFQNAATLFEVEKERLMHDEKATEKELNDCKENLARTYHNAGVLFHSNSDYQNAIAAYKEALRNNPADHETRYNLIHALEQLKQQQDQQQNEENQQDNQEQQQEQQQEEQMSKENAEQLLDAAMQDEKELQERVMKQMQVQPRGELDKDW